MPTSAFAKSLLPAWAGALDRPVTVRAVAKTNDINLRDIRNSLIHGRHIRRWFAPRPKTAKSDAQAMRPVRRDRQ